MKYCGSSSRTGAPQVPRASFKAPTRAPARAAILLALIAMMAQQWSVTQAVPLMGEKTQTQVVDLASFGFTDWLEEIGSKLGKALEEAKEKAEEVLGEIEVVGKDAWDKIKDALGEIEVAKDKFMEKVLPQILKALKTASASGEAAAEAVIERVVDLLKELGTSSLEKALSYIISHRDQIEHKIYEIITAHLMKAIGQATGLDTYAHNSLHDDQLKFVLIKLLDRCEAEALLLDVSVILALKPFNLQRAASILRDMKIENPVDSDVIDALLMRVDAVDGLIQNFGHGPGNIFEDILKKLIARVEEDPAKVAKVILRVFLPMGKEALLMVLHQLKEIATEWPTDSLQTVIQIIEKAMVSGGKTDMDIEKEVETEMLKKDILDILPNLAEDALDRLFQNESSLKSVEDQFINRVLPVLIAVAKNMANKTSEGATKVAELFVSLLRRLGSRAIEAAINFVEDHEAEIGERLHDFLLQRLQDALAEINYVREFGLNNLVHSLNRSRQ